MKDVPRKAESIFSPLAVTCLPWLRALHLHPRWRDVTARAGCVSAVVSGRRSPRLQEPLRRCLLSVQQERTGTSINKNTHATRATASPATSSQRSIFSTLTSSSVSRMRCPRPPTLCLFLALLTNLPMPWPALDSPPLRLLARRFMTPIHSTIAATGHVAGIKQAATGSSAVGWCNCERCRSINCLQRRR